LKIPRGDLSSSFKKQGVSQKTDNSSSILETLDEFADTSAKPGSLTVMNKKTAGNTFSLLNYFIKNKQQQVKNNQAAKASSNIGRNVRLNSANTVQQMSSGS
jgi:hypothetical protein